MRGAMDSHLRPVAKRNLRTAVNLFDRPNVVGVYEKWFTAHVSNVCQVPHEFLLDGARVRLVYAVQSYAGLFDSLPQAHSFDSPIARFINSHQLAGHASQQIGNPRSR